MPLADEVSVQDLIPEAELTRLQQGREEETLQPLMDLGYLHGNPIDTKKITNAIRQFRQEYLEFDLLPDFTPNFLFLPTTEIESEELNLLHTLTAIDGDFRIELLPEIGHVNILTRIIHYRLDILQLYEDAIDAPFSETSLAAIRKPREWIGQLPNDDLELVNWLGNVPAFIVHLDQHGGLNRRIVAFKYDQPRVALALREEVEEDDEEDDKEEDEDALQEEEAAINKDLDKLMSKIESPETVEIERLERRHKKRRSKLIKVEELMLAVHKEQNKVMAQAGLEGEMVTASVNNLREQESSLSKKILLVEGNIRLRETLLKTAKEQVNSLHKKQKKLRKLEGKRRPKLNKIAKLKSEIEPLKGSEERRDELLNEIVPFKAQLPSLNENLKQVKKLRSKKQKELDQLIDNLNSDQRELQGQFQELKGQLDHLESRVNKLKFSFKSRLRRVLDDDYYDDVIKPKVYRQKDRKFLGDISLEAYNKFLIRLIQVFQWTNGYYYGMLDSDIGDQTFQSIDDLVSFTPGLRIKYVLARLSDRHDGTKGFWILNVRYFFQKVSLLIQSRNMELTSSDLLKEYETHFLDDPNVDSYRNKVTDRAFEEYNREAKKGIKKKGIIRRIYFGIRSLASSLFKLMGNLLRLIKKGLKKLIYLVKNLIKIVYKEIREGVRKYRQGMSFLFGKRQFETITDDGQIIASKFDFDFDCKNIASPYITIANLQKHNQTLITYSNNMDFAMILTARVLKWVWKLLKAQSPITWAKLALRIAIYFKNLIIDWLLGRNRKQKPKRKKIVRILYKATSLA